MANAGNTYLGPWINWGYGAIRGSTLTLSSRNGSLLLAFVAIFVALAANAIWRILAFTIHQVRAVQVDHDGLHHQHQIILRITESPARALWEFVQLIYYWRNRADKSFLRSLGMAFLALFCVAIIGVASVFSARVVNAYGHQTLIIGDHCGLWTTGDSGSNTTGLSLKLGQDTLAADAYVRQCYGTDGKAPQCSQYYKNQITWRNNTNADCPFSSEVCSTNASAFEMDTGLLNSFDHLGWNTPKSQRIEWRRKTTCALLTTVNHRSTINITADLKLTDGPYSHIGALGDTVDFFNVGPQVDIANYTFAYNRHTAIDDTGYSLHAFVYMPELGSNNTWAPIDALRREDADTTVVFLNANGITYASPIKDPFFKADEFNVTIETYGDSYTAWTSTYWTATMACADQYQICNPRNGQCTNLSSLDLLTHNDIGLNSVQFSIAGILSSTLLWQSIHYSINGRGASALRAQDLVTDLVSQALPDNQWQIELASWFATSLARLQQSMLEYATGPSNTSGTAIPMPVVDPIAKALCYSQMVPSARDTISFSIANLSIVLIVSTLLILTNFSLDTVVGFIQRKMDPRSPRRLQWILNEKLQLQRMAFEEAGMGEWSGGADAVPVTTRREKFGAISEDVDMQHPRLYWKKEGGTLDEKERFLDNSDGEGKTGTTAEVRRVTGS